jgi:hypothetical protein
MTDQYVYIAQQGYGYIVNADSDTRPPFSLQILVDGLIECVRSREFDCDVWVNEEGLFREDFYVNAAASTIANQTLVGPAVLTNVDSEGRTTGITQAQLLTLRSQGLPLDDNDGKGWGVVEAAGWVLV